jgi:hypothetical protein
MFGQLSLSCASFHCFDAMDDETVAVKVSKALKMSFEVSLGRLAFIANCHSVVLIEVS